MNQMIKIYNYSSIKNQKITPKIQRDNTLIPSVFMPLTRNNKLLGAEIRSQQNRVNIDVKKNIFSKNDVSDILTDIENIIKPDNFDQYKKEFESSKRIKLMFEKISNETDASKLLKKCKNSQLLKGIFFDLIFIDNSINLDKALKFLKLYDMDKEDENLLWAEDKLKRIIQLTGVKNISDLDSIQDKKIFRNLLIQEYDNYKELESYIPILKEKTFIELYNQVIESIYELSNIKNEKYNVNDFINNIIPLSNCQFKPNNRGIFFKNALKLNKVDIINKIQSTHYTKNLNYSIRDIEDGKIFNDTSLKLIKNYFSSENINYDDKYYNIYNGNQKNKLEQVVTIVPEFINLIGKNQDKTKSYTSDFQTFYNIKTCLKNADYENLDENNKKLVLLAIFLQNIKTNNNNEENAFKAYNIIQRFDLSFEEQNVIFKLIKYNDWYKDINKSTENDKMKAIKLVALRMKNENFFKMAQILAKINIESCNDKSEKFIDSKDLEQIKSNIIKYQNYNEKIKKSLNFINFPDINTLKQSIFFNQQKLSNIAYIDEKYDIPVINFIELMKLNDNNQKEIFEILNFGKDKTMEDFNILVHGFSNQEIGKFAAKEFVKPSDETVISCSYLSQNNFNTFKKYNGFIFDNSGKVLIHSNKNLETGFSKTDDYIIDFLNYFDSEDDTDDFFEDDDYKTDLENPTINNGNYNNELLIENPQKIQAIYIHQYTPSDICISSDDEYDIISQVSIDDDQKIENNNNKEKFLLLAKELNLPVIIIPT